MIGRGTSPIVLLLTTIMFLLGCATSQWRPELTLDASDLHFDSLPTTWDEGIPLGNGVVGALVWQKDDKLRFSLDRSDLWDLRPMENLHTPAWRYAWVHEQWQKNDYDLVQEKFDKPYNRSPAPSKIPGAALEFDMTALGPVESVHLYLDQAVCEVLWKSGVRLRIFVHATDPVGWYHFEGLHQSIPFEMVAPAYNLAKKSAEESPVTGQDLRRLGYPAGKLVRAPNAVTYVQEGWGGFEYQVTIRHEELGDKSKGCWSISSAFPGWEKTISAPEVTADQMQKGISDSWQSHLHWWRTFWSKSSISVPDEILQKQWKLAMYKFGSAARSGAPPISLQSVWTADNGKLPPWKGDFHHDLNTQLSYWPAYSGNHLEEEMGFLEWLWKHRVNFQKYTQDYFETEGLNVPGVTTLTGQPMGGWIQYSFGPTVSAWLAQHYYLHWRYSMDTAFLSERAYPWIKEVAIFLDHISEIDGNGLRKLPISSSPEIYNNSKEAWFGNTTNFDLALIRWTFEKAAELAKELGMAAESTKWKNHLAEWPALSIDEQSGLMIAPDTKYEESHRHFSHLLAFHPLGIIDFSNGESDQQVIRHTIATLDEVGSKAWVGYSFSWLGNLKARAFDGDAAAEVLRLFSTSFCLPNSFHVNGDQSGLGYSDFTYRPFTLEGNFAFASGLQEMLIQSHSGAVHIFPAVPVDWKDLSFRQLRTEGAFLVSAEKKAGQIQQIEINSTVGGQLRLINPFDHFNFKCSEPYELIGQNILVFDTHPDQSILLSNKET